MAKPNDPCPCGSGEKFKECCGMNNNDSFDDDEGNDSGGDW